MRRRVEKISQKYFLVTNPVGFERVILAVDKDAAINFAAEKDKYFYEISEYTARISKI